MAVKRIVWLTFIACLWLAATALISRGKIAKQVFTTGYIGHFSSTQTNDLRFKLPPAQGFGFLLVTTNGPPQGSVTIRSGQAEAIERFEPAQLIDATGWIAGESRPTYLLPHGTNSSRLLGSAAQTGSEVHCQFVWASTPTCRGEVHLGFRQSLAALESGETVQRIRQERHP
jgi:hypothetical protein